MFFRPKSDNDLAKPKRFDIDWRTWIVAFVGCFSLIALRHYSMTYPYNNVLWKYNQSFSAFLTGNPLNPYTRFDTFSMLGLFYVMPTALALIAKRFPLLWAFAPLTLQLIYAFSKWNLMQAGYISGPPMMNPSWAFRNPDAMNMFIGGALGQPALNSSKGR
jgi:hypothetical protein